MVCFWYYVRFSVARHLTVDTSVLRISTAGSNPKKTGLVCLWNGFDRLCIVEKFKVIEVEKVVEVPFEVEKVFVERLFYLVVLAPNTVTETPLGEIVTDAENEIIEAPSRCVYF